MTHALIIIDWVFYELYTQNELLNVYFNIIHHVDVKVWILTI